MRSRFFGWFRFSHLPLIYSPLCTICPVPPVLNKFVIIILTLMFQHLHEVSVIIIAILIIHSIHLMKFKYVLGKLPKINAATIPKRRVLILSWIFMDCMHCMESWIVMDHMDPMNSVLLDLRY